MSLIKKDYYRINELDSLFNVSFEDVKYLVNEGKLNLWAFKDTATYIVGVSLPNKGFVGFGVANYRGLIKLSNMDQRMLLVKQKIDIKSFGINNGHQIIKFSSANPFDTPLPNGFIYQWIPKSIEELKQDLLGAIAMPLMIQDPIKMIKASSKAFKDGDKVNAMEHLNAVPKELLPNYLKIALEDVCIRREDLITLGLVETGVAADSPQNLHIEAKKRVFKHDFHKLLARILESNIGIQKKQVYKILCEELERLEDDRIYDKDRILAQATDDGGIVWIDKYSEKREKYCGFKTLNNHLTDTKKVLNERTR